jgi:hypothetical protein
MFERVWEAFNRPKLYRTLVDDLIVFGTIIAISAMVVGLCYLRHWYIQWSAKRRYERSLKDPK